MGRVADSKLNLNPRSLAAVEHILRSKPCSAEEGGAVSDLDSERDNRLLLLFLFGWKKSGPDKTQGAVHALSQGT